MNRLTKMATILAIALLAFLPMKAGAGTSSQKDDNYQNNENYSENNQSNYNSDDNQPSDYNSDNQQQPDNYQNYSQGDQGQNYLQDNNAYPQDNNYGDNYNNNYSPNNNYAPSGQADYNATLNNYGQWVSVAPFGRVWRPNVSSDWRPFSDGHWVTTSYGQTWEGNEPWAWATYHYGNWIWNQQYGWVWIPGATYSPGNVSWSYGPDSIGWMPAPPYGYDYSRGYLSYVGPVNQFSYYDSGFGLSFSFGHGYYPAAYQPLFFSPAYVSIVPNLWFFIGRSHFVDPNCGRYYLGSNYVHTVFVQRNVRINSRPIQRDVLQRIVQRPLPVVTAHERTITLNGHQTKFVDLVGHDQRISQNARPEFTKNNNVRTPGNSNLATKVQQEKQIQSGQPRSNENSRAIQDQQRKNFNLPNNQPRRDEQFIPNEKNQKIQTEPGRDFRSQTPERQFHMENGKPPVVSVAPPRNFKEVPQHQPEIRPDNQSRDRQKVEDARQTNDRQTPRREPPAPPKKQKTHSDHRPQ